MARVASPESSFVTDTAYSLVEKASCAVTTMLSVVDPVGRAIGIEVAPEETLEPLTAMVAP